MIFLSLYLYGRYQMYYINDLFGFVRWNILTITCEIHGGHYCRNIQLASRLQVHYLHQYENHIYHRLASTVHCLHLHQSATDLHHTQVRHPFSSVHLITYAQVLFALCNVIITPSSKHYLAYKPKLVCL